ncbi:MAG: DUF4417 domain-containing protein [Clostridia bacterium]|jgi:hypothetical protein|nr:DUF4417 domain-containing protein [Clostridia bacterium]MBR0438365.1 DUF4417 domain-containing protein [Clostridia bacterium]
MIKGLTEYEKYKVVRPILGECKYDSFDMPVIRKTSMDVLDWDKLKVINYQNACVKTSSKNTLVLMFNYDKRLLALWNNPLKRIGLFQAFAAIGTPDFSIYPSMNTNEIRHNIFMSRWLGVTWQNYNCLTLPTVGWALPDTYDICFSGLEYGSIVIISTIGCQNRKREFLNGFAEMKARINPPLIIVFGDMIEGMTGTFVNYRYADSFRRKAKHEQMFFDGISKIFTVKEVE